MEENKDYSYSLRDIINTSRTFLKYLFKKWWLLVLAMIVGAGLGTLYYFNQKPKYEAITTFILEDRSANNNGLAGLASQMGFNLSGLTGGGNIFSGDNILTILKSKKIVEQVLLSRIDSGSHNGKSLADYYLEFTDLRKNWQKKPLLANIDLTNIKNQITPLQDSILNVIYQRIIKKNLFTEKTSKQGSIIKVTVTASNCLFARLLAGRLVDEASKLYMDIRTGTAQDNIRQMQKRSDSILILLNTKSYSAAANQPLDANPGIKTAAVPAEIRIRDKTILATLYAEVTKNLEASKLLLSQQTPVIQLLDTPGYLLKDQKKGLFFLLVVSLILSAFFYSAGALFSFLTNNTGSNQVQ